jgi:hypothetical protein
LPGAGPRIPAGSQREPSSRYATVIVASHHMRDEMARNGVPDDRLKVLLLFHRAATPRCRRRT